MGGSQERTVLQSFYLQIEGDGEPLGGSKEEEQEQNGCLECGAWKEACR